MVVRLIIVCLLLLVTQPAFAQQQSGERCAVLADDVERLACYDEIFRAKDDPVDAPQVRILSEQQIPARPVGRAPAEMVIDCRDTMLEVHFSFANQLLSNTGDDAPVTFQVDQGGNTVRNLPVNASNTAVGFDAPKDAAAFLDTLEGARNLKVRMTPVRQRSQTVDFRIAQYADDIGALRGLCG